MMPSNTQIRPVELRLIPALAHLDDAALAPFIDSGEIREYVDGEELFQPGGEVVALFFVLEGAVQVSVPLPSGGEADLALLSEGSILGEVALLARRARTASARASGALRVFRADKEQILDDYRAGKEYALALMFGVARLLAERLLAMNERVAGLLDPQGRPTDIDEFRRKILDDWKV